MENNIGLIFKWLKSENTSSKESCKLGTLTRKSWDCLPGSIEKCFLGVERKLKCLSAL